MFCTLRKRKNTLCLTVCLCYEASFAGRGISKTYLCQVINFQEHGYAMNMNVVILASTDASNIDALGP